MGVTSMLQASALRGGASSAVDTVANMSEHATEAEERVISYETDAYSVYTKGSYPKASKPNYGPLARDVAGDNRGTALKGLTKTKLGGAYKDVPANGGQVHHMPANSISPYSKGKGPGIRMETKDHMETASWGSSKKAKLYRQRQKELIDQGKFREAQQMDIDDVHSKFNNKYDNAIEEMRRYTNQLLNDND